MISFWCTELTAATYNGGVLSRNLELSFSAQFRSVAHLAPRLQTSSATNRRPSRPAAPFQLARLSSTLSTDPDYH